MQEKLHTLTSSFQNFITNQGANTLESKLQIVLNKPHLKYIDFLIGYLRISGFHKIITCLESIEESRILVGINIDKATFDVNKKANDTKNINQFAKEQIKYFNNESDEIKHNNMTLLINFIKNSKLQIRVAPHNDIHAKLYIIRDTKEPNNDSDGSVIIGSSNLTYNGLRGHLELNTEIKGSGHIVEATQIFNILWDEAQPISVKDIETQIIPNLRDYPPKQKEITQDSITPYQLYIKALQVYFDKRVDVIDFNSDDMPKDFKSFNYQSDAVQDGIDKLNKYNGFYLADVVGLGKTIIAILIIKRLKLKTLVVAPNAVINQWKKAIKDFKIENIECISKDSVLTYKNTDNELIVVDEAHNFRNSDTNRYPALQKICKHPYQKKIMLLSATPQNNEPLDIANQLYLFQNQNNSTIPNLLKLKAFFDTKNSEYKEIIKDTSKDNKKALNKISQDIKNNVLKYIMTRRTRTDIENCEMYKSDIDSFPKLDELTPLPYELKDTDLIEKYNKTADDLSKNIAYARFKSLNKLTKKGVDKYKLWNQNLSDNIFRNNPLAELMQNQLIKRFESSFEAFKISLDRHTNRLEKFINKFKKNEIYLGKYSNDFLDDKEKYFIEDNKVSYINKKGNKKTLQGHIFTKDDFEDDFLSLLEDDLNLFKVLNDQWKNEDRDPKIKVLKKELEKYKDMKTKVVVFTESQDTGRYLYKNLSSKKLKILYIDSTNRDENIEIIAQNFDANIDKQEQQNDYNIIITTDTLAEGINLHRSNCQGRS